MEELYFYSSKKTRMNDCNYLLINILLQKTRKERSSLKNKRSTGKDKRASDQNERVCG